MKYIILLILLMVVSTIQAQAQTDSTKTAIANPMRIMADSIINYNLKMIDALEPLLVKKNTNTAQMLELIKVNTAWFKTELLLADMKLSETKIHLFTTTALLKKEKKKNLWRTIGVGVGGLAVGVLVGSF